MLIFLKCLLLLLPFSVAEFSLSSGLTKENRVSVLEVLGLGSSVKNISTLAPLGTDSGLEVAIAFEFINTDTINNYITDKQSQNTLYYPKIIIGKGIYDHLDLYFQFIPYTATFGISEFGSLLRYNFYKMTDSPFYITGMIHANSANFNNQLVSRNLGTDLMFGYGPSPLSVFTTLGWTGAYGKFVGGTNGITDTGVPEKEEVNALHAALGINSQWNYLNMTLSLDYYVEPVYTAKISLIF
jgi:hypothetical protein